MQDEWADDRRALSVTESAIISACDPANWRSRSQGSSLEGGADGECKMDDGVVACSAEQLSALAGARGREEAEGEENDGSHRTDEGGDHEGRERAHRGQAMLLG